LTPANDCAELQIENSDVLAEFGTLVREVRAFANGLIASGEREIGEGLLSLLDGE
jgi:hypothetical protein